MVFPALASLGTLGRRGETLEGWERCAKGGRDVGWPREMWGGWERRGDDGRDVGMMGEKWEGLERRGKAGRD